MFPKMIRGVSKEVEKVPDQSGGFEAPLLRINPGLGSFAPALSWQLQFGRAANQPPGRDPIYDSWASNSQALEGGL
jgi:hypothetical protein